MILKWFGHVELMHGERLIIRVYKSYEESRKDGGWSCTWCLDGVKMVSFASSLKLRDAKVKSMHRKQWSAFANGI